jgi:O-antigen ligase
MRDLPHRPSFWLFLPAAWYFIAATRNVDRWIAAATGRPLLEEAYASAADKIEPLVLAGLVCAALLIIARRTPQLCSTLKDNRWLLALYLYMLFSISWSAAPAASFSRWLHSAGALALVLVVATERRPMHSATALLAACYYAHIPLSLLAIKYVRDIGVAWSRDGVTEMWTGLTMHKNNLGQVAMSSALLFTWLIFKEWPRRPRTLHVLYLLMSLWLLRGSDAASSTTSIFGFAIGLSVILGCRYHNSVAAGTLRRWLVGGGLVLVLLYTTLELTQQDPLGGLLHMSGRDATLTGRTALWADVVEIASDAPLLGVGFGALWNVPFERELYPLKQWSVLTPTWRPKQGHNGYLDVFAELGFFGLSAVGVLGYLALRRAGLELSSRPESATLRLMFLTTILVNNITETSLLRGTHSLWFLFLLFAVAVPIRPVDHGSTAPARVAHHTWNHIRT